MAKLLEMPKLSPTMEEGQIGAWKKAEGDKVEVDDLLAEVETDKATMEFRSFDKGTLLKILAPAGSMVKLGQPVAVIGNPGEDVAGLTSGAGPAPAAASAPAAVAPAAVAPAAAAPAAAAPAAAAPAPASAPAPTDGRIKASPYVRKVARERGVSLASVTGSGPNGRIIARDLEGAAAAPALPASTRPAAAGLAPSEAHPLSMMRRTIARRLTESKQTVPHFYLTSEIDADPLHALRERVVADLHASLGDGAPRVSVNDFIVKAVAIALTRVPACNASFTPDALLFHKRIDISVAVAVEDGLVTPVVRDADKKPLLEISREVRELADRAKKKKLAPEEMTNGTFSVSNLGMFGIDSFSAVINPPEGAILALGQIRRVPVVKGDELVPGRTLAMTMSCDHRVIDGAVGAGFLKILRDILEHPGQILLF